ncbi:DedA family protein [Alicyclobacillus ferrooxydans]|uniref:DedA family protein n=1 Tax=Alicyclobacillus ferrooxydans TaxID=471514 RepID=UPI0006D54757|nr:DedA family protein [Alicyclobacillus ferrooxydans]
MLDWFGHGAEAVLSLGYLGTYLALVVEGLGLPFPGDAVMVLYGLAAANGKFQPGALILISVAGYLTGAVISYALSRYFGSVWLDRWRPSRMMNLRSFERTTSLLNKYGPMLLVPGRFLPGVRSVSSYVAGAVRMEFSPFFLYTGIGVIAWCAIWVLLGFWFGEHITAVMHTIQSYLLYITGGLFAIGGTVWVVRRKLRTPS